ncbi:T9SS type B sorting domain-containing protein [Polaribacter sp.]|uniref:Ig-like domain-containing protein n=1 Tax=Polaribacter sp. TaxID=1920175 RepID=UPI003F6A7073
MNKSLYLKYKLVLIYFLCVCSVLFAQTDNAPSITAVGRQAFCLGSPINVVTDFTITDSDDTGIDAFFIQISSGYQANIDFLELTGSHPNIVSNWNINEGKLTLTAAASATEIVFADLERAVKEVVFTTAVDNIAIEKIFSLTVDDTNYLPSTDHFYEFISDIGIRWDEAKMAAESKTYYGRQGYLATLTTQEEADFAGKQASGAGWIGGSDEETEGVWKWVTGPEAGTVFWNGGNNGSSPNFENWNINQPDNFHGGVGEDYLHITDPSIGNPGQWNDLRIAGDPPGPYHPKGYIVEYGVPSDPSLNIVASTSIYIPQVVSTTDAIVCEFESATISAIPSEGEILWHDNPNRGTQPELARGNNFTVNNITETTTYYATVSVNGCVTLDRIPVTITVIQKPTIINTVDALICSGNATLSAEASAGDVYWYDSASSTTPIFIGDNYETPNLTTTTSFFVEANNSGCVSLNRTEVIARVDNTVPEFDLVQDVYVLCEDIGSIDLETTNAQGSYTYVWQKDGALLTGDLASITINSSGTYTVIGRSAAGCESLTKTILVTNSEKASITKDDILIIDDSDNNSIEVITKDLGIGNYEFAIDDEFGVYKQEGIFNNISTGMHTLFIKDKGGCGIEQYQFSILEYTKFFTPNNDGKNDYWNIKGFDKNFYTVSDIYIYNRFGVLLHKINPEGLGWNGTYEGKKLPSNSYWFKTLLTDKNGLSVEKNGSFSLIRK